MAFTGAILGHVNPRSTAIYAHGQHSPACGAERIAAALADIEDRDVDAPPADENEAFLAKVAELLMKGGPDADRLRAVVSVLVS